VNDDNNHSLEGEAKKITKKVKSKTVKSKSKSKTSSKEKKR
jgi:hypothetical protein